MHTIIHIVPSYPPYKGGVADFCELIVNTLKEKNHYIISYQQNAILNGTNKVLTKQPTPFNLKNCIQTILNKSTEKEPTTIMLHYVSYGYHKYGIPIFLYKDIKTFVPQLNLLTFFHEIYSLGKKKPWQSSFWCRPIQKKIILNLASISNTVFTNNQLYKKKITALGVDKKIHCQHVFSNIGEVESIFQNRKNELIIFGGNGLKKNIEKNIVLIENKLSCLKIDTVVNIGAPLALKSIKNIKIMDLGYLPSNHISELFTKAKYGLISYNNMPIEKSGVFAAYIAHGIVPILIDAKITSSELQQVIDSSNNSNLLFNWYQSYASINSFCTKLQTIINGY